MARSIVVGQQTLADTLANAITIDDAGAEGYLKAWSTNTGIVYVSKSASLSSTNGYPLSPGDTFPQPIDDLAGWYARAASSGDKLAFTGQASE